MFCLTCSLISLTRVTARTNPQELRITALLFGSLVARSLVAGGSLTLALRCVLESLRKAPGSKLHAFGCDALAQFRQRLADWPAPQPFMSFAKGLLVIPHLRASHADLLTFLERQAR